MPRIHIVLSLYIIALSHKYSLAPYLHRHNQTSSHDIAVGCSWYSEFLTGRHEKIWMAKPCPTCRLDACDCGRTAGRLPGTCTKFAGPEKMIKPNASPSAYEIPLTHHTNSTKTNLRSDQGHPTSRKNTALGHANKKDQELQEHARTLGQLRDSVTQFGFVASRRGMRSSPSLAKSQAEC